MDIGLLRDLGGIGAALFRKRCRRRPLDSSKPLEKLNPERCAAVARRLHQSAGIGVHLDADVLQLRCHTFRVHAAFL